MARLEKRKLDRFQYWQGQKLKSRDFRDIQADTAQHRWWHNRALHNAYGIYKGFGVSVSTDPFVEVRPGVAYDCFGRELILQTTQTVSIPAPSTPEQAKEPLWYLLVRYRESACSGGDESAGACWGHPDRLLLDTVEFIWKPKPFVTVTDGVPVASIELKGTQFRLLPDLARPAAQPLASSLVVSGSTVPGNTAWSLWAPVAGNAGPAVILGVQTTIDTSAAGFTDIPIYFAWLEGSLWNQPMQQLVPALLPSISDEAATSFTFQLCLPVFSQFELLAARREGAVLAAAKSAAPATQLIDANSFPLFAQQQGLYVSWVGCQCLSACRSTPKATHILKSDAKP